MQNVYFCAMIDKICFRGETLGRGNTEQEFLAAFWRLYAVSPVERISVRQLCQAAGYNRATFYNHFADIYDLLNQAVESILGPVQSELTEGKDFLVLLQGNQIEEMLLKAFLQKDQEIELLFKRQDYDILGEKIKKMLVQYIENELEEGTECSEMIRLLAEYQISAVLGAIRYWYQQGKKIPGQELLKRLYEISSKGVLSLLREEISGKQKKET